MQLESELPIETKRIRMNEQDQAVVDEQSQELVAPLTLHDQRCAQHAQKAANANWQQ
jgi:hypothetical protein